MRGSGNQAYRSGSVASKLFTAGLVVLFLIIAVVAGLFIFDQVRQFIAASDTLPPFTGNHDEGGEVDYEPGQPLLRWKGTERVNILVMGIDQRKHEDGPWRTDTMVVLTIDPITLTAGMLSIPRDLWVPIPGYEDGRINTAHYIGEIDGYPGGGPALAVKTVRYNLGIPIHHYARVNFTVFERVIDLIGGVDVYVKEEIDDPTYPSSDPADPYGYDPLFIPAGQHHFDGEMALKYARTRYTAGGDFDRAKRQQQVLTAIFKRVTQPDQLPQLASRAPELWRTLQDSVVTDLTLDQVIALAQLASQVNPENIRYGVIDENYTQFWTTPDEQQVLIPLRDRMRALRDYIFTVEAPLPREERDPAARLEDEDATIEVLNGTTTAGLAAEVSKHLRQGGLQIARTGNATRSDVPESLIIVYTDKTYTAEYIAQLLGFPPTSVVHGSDSDPAAEYDVSVILGADYQPSER